MEKQLFIAKKIIFMHKTEKFRSRFVNYEVAFYFVIEEGPHNPA